MLVYVIDMSQPEPWSQLSQLQYELDMYQSGLSTRPAAVLANKIDLEETRDKMERMTEVVRQQNMDLIPVSGRTGINLAEMLIKIKQLHDKFKENDNNT